MAHAGGNIERIVPLGEAQIKVPNATTIDLFSVTWNVQLLSMAAQLDVPVVPQSFTQSREDPSVNVTDVPNS